MLGTARPKGGAPPGKVDHGGPADLPRVRVLPDQPIPFDRPQPVLTAPEILDFWVPAHVDADRDMMVGGHQVSIKVRDSEWFPQRVARQLAEADAAAVADDYRFAAQALSNWDQGSGIVPWWGPPKK